MTNKLTAIRLGPATVELLAEQVGEQGEPYLRVVLEDIINDWIIGQLENSFSARAIDPKRVSHAKLCRLWLNFTRAMKGQKGYDIVWNHHAADTDLGPEDISIEEAALILKAYKAEPLKILKVVGPDD